MTRCIVIHYAEIGLKGKNRRFFERQLQRNVRQRLAGPGVTGVKRLPGRLLAQLGTEGSGHRVAEAIERLRTVPGIAYFAPVYVVPKDVEAIKVAVVEKLAGFVVSNCPEPLVPLRAGRSRRAQDRLTSKTEMGQSRDPTAT